MNMYLKGILAVERMYKLVLLIEHETASAKWF